MPQISVIVPVYNVEKYLHRCVDSILAQTFTDFELILVDDGSPDNCGAICDEYAAKDSRIRVIHKENGGVSSARNAGIDAAGGEYSTFIDSDDYVTADYLAGLMRTSADLVCQTAVMVYEKDGTEHRCHMTPQKINNPDSNQIRELLLKGGFNWTPCKRFRTNIISTNHVQFNHKVNFGEDTLFVVEYTKYARTICVEDIANYRYVIYDSRQTLSNSFHADRMQMIKTANHLICHAVSDGENEIEQRTYLQRMRSPYYDYLRQNIFVDTYYIKLNGFKHWLWLSKDDDFRQLIDKADGGLVPEQMKRALLSQNKLFMLFVHLYMYAWRTAHKLRRLLL